MQLNLTDEQSRVLLHFLRYAVDDGDTLLSAFNENEHDIGVIYDLERQVRLLYDIEHRRN